jgi:hypothetical protein
MSGDFGFVTGDGEDDGDVEEPWKQYDSLDSEPSGVSGFQNEVNSNLPDSPTEKLQFGVYTDTTVDSENLATEAGGDEARDRLDQDRIADFNPLYYPERVVVTSEKELNRVGAGCEGQKVTIQELKNADVSIVGKMHSEDLSDLQEISRYDGTVEVLCPVLKGSGMDMIIKSTEYGEILGWDGFPTAQDWLMNYKIDLVSTGDQEYGTGEGSNFEQSTFETSEVAGGETVGGSSTITENL